MDGTEESNIQVPSEVRAIHCGKSTANYPILYHLYHLKSTITQNWTPVDGWIQRIVRFHSIVVPL